MSAVERAGLFAPLDDGDASSRSRRSTAPRAALWTGFVARSTVLVYNTSMVDEADLPDSIMDLADPGVRRDDLVLARPAPTSRPSWPRCSTSRARRRPSSGSTASRPTARCTTATTWCSSRSTPASRRSGSSTTTTGTATRPRPATNSDNTELYFFGNQDPGAFLSISGAGVLAAGDNPDEAQQFVAYLTSEEGQQALADSYALEYPLNPAVSSGTARSSRSRELEPPTVAISDLDGDKVVEMMTEAGFL